LIKTFHDRETEQLYTSSRSRRFQSCARQAFQKLRMIDAAGKLADLGILPGNRLEPLKGSQGPIQHPDQRSVSNLLRMARRRRS